MRQLNHTVHRWVAVPSTLFSEVDRELRLAALRVGWWLGWLSVAAVLAGLALDLPARDRPTLIVLTALAAAGNGAAMAIPWQRWLTVSRGQVLLDLWSAGLVSFVAVLVAVAGANANLDLLLFLIVPFLATVHQGVRRVLWLTAAGLSFLAVMLLAPSRLTAGEVAMRAALLAATTMLTLVLGRMIRREATAHASASARAELEHALLAESHHRVKNSLQTVADLLLLGRPPGPGGAPFDWTAERIRAIGAVHDLLAGGRGGAIRADALIRTVGAAAGVPADVAADPLELDPAHAQRIGIVVNELLTNAARHGQFPVSVRLRGTKPAVLTVSDHGPGPNGAQSRLGLQLVGQVVEQALHGTFSLGWEAEGLTVARVEFPLTPDAHPDR
jgi:two-component sensor histidine kinase